MTRLAALLVALASAAMITGCADTPPMTPGASGQVVAATERLFAGHNAAFEESPEAGWEYQVAHNYPGYADATEISAQQLRDRMVAAGYWEKFAPDLTSLTPDPDWTPSTNDLPCLADLAAPLADQTFKVTVDRTGGETATNSLHPQQRADVHITLLDGELYYFIPLCA